MEVKMNGKKAAEQIKEISGTNRWGTLYRQRGKTRKSAAMATDRGCLGHRQTT